MIGNAPSRDMLIIARGWKLRPCPADMSTRNIPGRFSLGMRCANCNRLANVALANRLVVSSTRFQHPHRHLVTWFSGDGRTRNHIDHMLVWSRWASSVINCRAYIGAQTGSEHGSDHAMARARLRLHMTAARIPNHPAKLDTSSTGSPEPF